MIRESLSRMAKFLAGECDKNMSRKTGGKSSCGGGMGDRGRREVTGTWGLVTVKAVHRSKLYLPNT